MAGRRVKCPQCEKSLEVPQAKKPPEEAASVDNEAFLENLFGQNVSGSEETLDTEFIGSRSQQSTTQYSADSGPSQESTSERPPKLTDDARCSKNSASVTFTLPRLSKAMIVGGGVGAVVLLALAIVWFRQDKSPVDRQAELGADQNKERSESTIAVSEPIVAQTEQGPEFLTTPAASAKEPQANEIAKLKQPTEAKGLEQLIPTIEPAVVRLDVTTREGGGIGSGFVIDGSGIVVTNHHVIDGATSAKAAFADGTSVAVIGVLATDSKRDIAILKIQGAEKRFPTLKLLTGPPPKGLSVVAFGAPKGLSFSASEGIVSAVRSAAVLAEFGITVDGSWIQTTTPISPGNSGGPLVALTGEVVGINTFNIVKGQNLNFAVSASDIARIFDSAKTANALPLAMVAATKTNSGLVAKEVGSFKIPPKFHYDHKLAIRSEKGKFDTYRRIEIGPVRLDSETSLFLLLAVTDADRVSDNALLLISSASSNWRFKKFRTLKVIAGGDLSNLDEMAWDPEVKTAGLSVFCVERLNAAVPLSVLLKVACSQDSDFAIGSHEYRIDHSLRNAIRDALSRLPMTKTVSGIALEIDEQIEAENAEIVNAAKQEAGIRQARQLAAIEKAKMDEEIANEKKANGSLVLAKKYLSDGKTKLARQTLEGIVNRYPNTPARREADELLKKVTD